MSLKLPERVPLAMTPTPLHPAPRLSEALKGPQIYFKRDDLTGAALTGNKVRKLEFLLAQARAENAGVVITCGGVQSNHARTTAVAARRLGLKAHLLLAEDGSKSLTGNLFLDRLVDAEITFISRAEYEERADEVMAEIAQRYSEKGEKPYVIPEGGSNEIGAMGYLAAAEELHKQLQKAKLKPDALICVVGSGGTYAGLLLGKHLLNWPFEVVGINICDDAEYFTGRIREILAACRRRYDLDPAVEKLPITIQDGYVGKGYALNRQEEIDAIKKVARLEGVILDPVYTGKAMYGVMDLIAQGRWKRDQKIIFLHSGGIFGLFPKTSLFF